MNKTLKKVFQIAISLAFWLIVWGLVSYKTNNEFLFPSPIKTLGAVGEL